MFFEADASAEVVPKTRGALATLVGTGFEGYGGLVREESLEVEGTGFGNLSQRWLGAFVP